MCLCLIMEPNLMQSFSLKELDGHANLVIFNGNLLPEVDPSDSLEWLNLRNLRFSLFFHVEPCFIFLEA